MGCIDYDQWRDAYLLGANRNVRTRPWAFAVSPAKAICLGPVPADGYTITCDYFAAPSDMTLDADIPALPKQFHMAIIYRAMMSYGAYQSAQEVYQRGELEFNKLMMRMDRDRLPQLVTPGAMA